MVVLHFVYVLLYLSLIMLNFLHVNDVSVLSGWGSLVILHGLMWQDMWQDIGCDWHGVSGRTTWLLLLANCTGFLFSLKHLGRHWFPLFQIICTGHFRGASIFSLHQSGVQYRLMASTCRPTSYPGFLRCDVFELDALKRKKLQRFVYVNLVIHWSQAAWWKRIASAVWALVVFAWEWLWKMVVYDITWSVDAWLLW